MLNVNDLVGGGKWKVDGGEEGKKESGIWKSVWENSSSLAEGNTAVVQCEETIERGVNKSGFDIFFCGVRKKLRKSNQKDISVI